jgi:hypothetical protein
MSVDRRHFIGFSAAFPAAPLATACSGHEKVPMPRGPLELELSEFDSVVGCEETIRALNSPIEGCC